MGKVNQKGHNYKQKKFHKSFDLWNPFTAEREGFEPPVPLGTAVFKTAVIDHSTTFPIVLLRCFSIAVQR